MKLAANLSLLYPGLPLADRMTLAARDGFTGVEILFPYQLAPSALAQLLRSNGLELVLINTPPGENGEKGLACVPGQEPQFRQGFARALTVCEETGCRMIHVMAGMPPAQELPAACATTLRDNLRQAAALAEKVGVTITLEALNRHDMPGYFYYLPEQVAAVIQAVAHPAVRLQFDLYHSQREGLNLEQELASVREHVQHVQFAGVDGRHEPDLTDERVLNTLRALARGGYAGWIGCEYIPRADTTNGLAWRKRYQALLG